MANPADYGMNIGLNSAIGLPQMVVRDINLNFGGPSGFPQGRGDYTAVASDTLSWIHGRHSLKFGGEFRRFNGNNFASTAGTMDFTAVNDFINGQAFSFTANPSSNPSRIYVHALGAFVQDQWKVNGALTLELGLRYDWNGTPTEAQNRFVVFDPASAALVQAGAGPIGEVYKQNARNFQPRVGFAWDVFSNGQTVVRGAYAILTDQPVTNIVQPLASEPAVRHPGVVQRAGDGDVRQRLHGGARGRVAFSHHGQPRFPEPLRAVLELQRAAAGGGGPRADGGLLRQ